MENKAGAQRTHKGQRYQGTSTGDAGETDEPAKSEGKAQTGKDIRVSEVATFCQREDDVKNSKDLLHVSL